MIQPISNNVNFSGKVFAGGINYSDLTQLQENIQRLPNEELRQIAKKNIEKLRGHIADITPANANFALVFRRSEKINGNGKKIKLILKDLNTGDCTPIATKKIRPNGRLHGINNFFSKAKQKADALFQNSSKVQDIQQENIKHIDMTA